MGALHSGGVLSLGSLAGFLIVLGIAARNSIMRSSLYSTVKKKRTNPLVQAGASRRGRMAGANLDDGLLRRMALVPLVIGRN